MKKIIKILGIITFAIIIILNILYTGSLSSSEHVDIKYNNIIYVIGLLIVGFLIIIGTRKIDEFLYNKEEKSKQKIRPYLFLGAFGIYIVFNVIWGIMINPGVGADQIHVCNLAQAFYRGNVEETLKSITYAGIPLKEYIQCYPQQITLAFIYSIFFKITHMDILELLRIINIISNIMIVFAIYKIDSQISKKYKTNKVLLFTLILTFLSIPMLLTFIYGDIPSIALGLFSVYFMMKYRETKIVKYPIYSAILTMISYMMRMNSLIFIIATIIYLLIDLFEEFTKKTKKENIIKVAIIALYIIISIFPSTIVKNYYFKKYDLDKDKKYPTISFLLIAMEESPRANGWYSEEIRRNSIKRSRKYRRKIQRKSKTKTYIFF